MSRRRRVVWAAAAAGFLLAAWGSFYLPIPRGRLDPGPVVSLRVTDRRGALLREVLSDEGGRCRWVGLKEISPYLLKATIASEDKSFVTHPGVDAVAVVRAFVQNLKSQRVVSGASTITQQVVRNIYRFRRRFTSKLAEAWLAVRLDHTLSKDEILLQYLNRISYGNQAFGIEAAARQYFDKSARALSLSESAFLAAIPRAPAVLNPYRAFPAVKKRRDEILRRMRALGYIAEDALRRALDEPVTLRPPGEKFRAPHFVEMVLARLGPEACRGLAEIRTTLDAPLQRTVEALIRTNLAPLERLGVTNAAAVVLDNATGDILALAGSRDYFDERAPGQVNGALALRQPGSTVKPITYGLALERGLTAASILEDDPTPFRTESGTFAPDNYDESYHGRVRLRSALASSYNIPAVAVLQALGPDLLYVKMVDLGFAHLRRAPGYYGVGLTLGNAEVTLLELARAYASLARGGRYRAERCVLRTVAKSGRIESPPPAPLKRVFSPQAAAVITDILADRDARIPAFGYHSPLNLPFPSAAKTGTSKDFRDNWTVGYTTAVTVAVWAGDLEGRPMHGVSGVTGAGPLFRDILQAAASGRPAEEFREPDGLVRAPICPLSGLRPGPRCGGIVQEVFISGTEPRSECALSHAPGRLASSPAASVGARVPSGGIAVLFPADGDVFKLDPVLRDAYQSLRLRAAADEGLDVVDVEWLVDGRSVGREPPPFTRAWNLKPGSYTIVARARLARGAVDSRPVRITVLDK